MIHPRKPTNGTVVAIDIVGYSHLINDGVRLKHARQCLIGAVLRTSLFQEALKGNSVIAQYLGDELRLAFDQSKRLEDVSDFVHEVISTLANDSDAPDIRSALVEGLLSWDSLPTPRLEHAPRYIYGAAIEDELPQLLEVAGCEMKLVSNKIFEDSEKVSDNGPIIVWRSKKDIKLKAQKADMEIKDIGDLHCFVVAITKGVGTPRPELHLPTSTSQSTATHELLKLAYEALEGVKSPVKLSVGPSAVLVAIEDGDFSATKGFLSELRTKAQRFSGYGNLRPVVGISRGKLNVVTDYPWLGPIFEGKAAIVATRIASGVAKRKMQGIVFDAGCRDLVSQGQFQAIDDQIEGKRGEKFPVLLDTSWMDQSSRTLGADTTAVTLDSTTAEKKSKPSVTNSHSAITSSMSTQTHKWIDIFAKVGGWKEHTEILHLIEAAIECDSSSVEEKWWLEPVINFWGRERKA